jgi:tetratricopeptide (TPR) repeat protein
MTLRAAIILVGVIAAARLWPSETDLLRARRLFEQRDFAAAASALERYIQDAPGDRGALLLLGICRYQLGRSQEAEQVFREVIRRNPRDAQAHFYLALNEHLQGKLLEAEADARQALRLGWDASRSHHLIGKTREDRNRLADALASYQEALRADAASAEANLSAGQVLIKLRRAGDALPYLRRARERSPQSADAAYELGRALLLAGSRQEAEQQIDTAARLGHQPAERLLRRLRAGGAPASKAALESIEPAPVRFIDVAAEAGLHFTLENHASAEKHLIETMVGGVAAFDSNGDGRIDIFFTNGAETPSLKKTGPRYFNRLFRNDGDLRFTDVTSEAGLEGAGFSIGAAAADFDNDGRADLFVAGYPNNILYRNLGNGRFADVTREAGIRSGEWSVAGGWFDYDNDGLLDLFVVNYLDWSPSRNLYCGDSTAKLRVYCNPSKYKGTANRLYRNLGGGRFQDVSVASGIAAHVGKGMSLAFADYDLDGFMDVFVTNDRVPNFLFHNSGNGTFEERALNAGPALNDNGQAISAMGADFRDYNNDGFPDLIYSALAGETFPLFRNARGRAFYDRTYADGIGVLSTPHSGWSIHFADFNNDGWKDIFSANSHVTDNVELFSTIEKYQEPNSVWLNAGDGGFVEGSAASGAGFAVRRAHRGAAVADFDNDGRLDVVVSSLAGAAELWRNVSPGAAHWIGVQLEGRKSNRDGIGARVRVGTQVETVTVNAGYASSSRTGAHFGLGGNSGPVTIEIDWPSGVHQVLENAAPDRVLLVREPADQPRGR